MTITTARPTRRSLVRGAAWSLPVVSIAAAAPAFAASAANTTFGAVAGTAVKWGNGNEKHVSWDLLLTNGAVAIQSVSIAFTYFPTSGGGFEVFTIYGYAATTGPRDITWTIPSIAGEVTTATSTHGPIAANSTTRIHTDFAGDDNAAGTVSAVATITYVGVPGTTTKTIPAVIWGSDNEHTHPA